MCPKFLALPDLIRATVDNLPKVVEMSVDMKKKSKFISALETGKQLGKPLGLIKKAYGKAVDAQFLFLSTMQKGYSFDEALEAAKSKGVPGEKNRGAKTNIAVVGHGYNIHDTFINMDLLRKLEEMGVNPVVIENLPSEIFEGETSINKSLKNYWGNEEEILSALNYLFEAKSVDGIVFLCSFCCGPDSLIDEITTRNAKLTGIPYTCVVLDEHAGQAGLITRIESFIDMVVFRKNAEKREAQC
jgi:predicted nucleotide-binding protein (sugar kinase/HSP70/actin superfamily)